MSGSYWAYRDALSGTGADLGGEYEDEEPRRPAMSEAECIKNLRWLAGGDTFNPDDARREMRRAADLLEAHAAALASGNGGVAQYLVYSREHNAWWGPNRRGYTCDMAKAGRYSLGDVKDICGDDGCRGRRGYLPENDEGPSEFYVPAPDAKPTPACDKLRGAAQKVIDRVNQASDALPNGRSAFDCAESVAIETTILRELRAALADTPTMNPEGSPTGDSVVDYDSQRADEFKRRGIDSLVREAICDIDANDKQKGR